MQKEIYWHESRQRGLDAAPSKHKRRKMQTDCENTRDRSDTEHLNAHAQLFEALTACEFRVLFSIRAGALTVQALAVLEAEGLLWDCVGSKLSLNPAGGTCENIAVF